MFLHSDSYTLMLVCLGLFTLVGMAITNFDHPGVRVTEAVAGAIPIERLGFKTGKLVGTALRGPINKPILITSERQFRSIFGPRTSTSYLHDAIRMWFENVDAPCYVVRAVNAGALAATKTLVKDGTPQVETATVIGAITQNGNASVIVTAAGMTGSSITLNVAVLNGDSDATVAGKIRAALALNANVTARFAISGAGTAVVLTRLVAAANDATLNVSIDNGTCTGLTPAPNSANTTPGVADQSVLQVDSLGPGADYNYAASPAHGVSVTYVGGVLSVYDSGQLIELYRDVTFANATKSAQFINGHSELIQITWLDTTVDPTDTGAIQGVSGGANGSSVTATQIIGSESMTPKTGIYAFATKDLPLGYHLAPGYTTNAVGQALIDVAERFRGLALIDSTFGNSVQQAIAEKQGYASSHGYAIYVYGWVQMIDPDAGAMKWVPRSPVRAAHIARSHNQPGGLANVGAGVDYKLRNIPYDPQNGAFGLETDAPYLMDDLTQGELNRNGVDVARNFAREGYGIVHWAARTISPEILFRFLHVRVLLNVIAESIEIGLKPYVFRSVDGRGRLGAEIKASIDQLLWDLWNNDSLFGATPGEAFFVKLLSSFAELEQGVINVEVYVKPVPIAERINVTLFRVALGYDFKTGQVKIGSAELTAAA